MNDWMWNLVNCLSFIVLLERSLSGWKSVGISRYLQPFGLVKLMSVLVNQSQNYPSVGSMVENKLKIFKRHLGREAGVKTKWSTFGVQSHFIQNDNRKRHTDGMSLTQLTNPFMWQFHSMIDWSLLCDYWYFSFRVSYSSLESTDTWAWNPRWKKMRKKNTDDGAFFLMLFMEEDFERCKYFRWKSERNK